MNKKTKFLKSKNMAFNIIRRVIAILLLAPLAALACASVPNETIVRLDASATQNTDENLYTDAVKALEAVNRLAAAGISKVTLQIAPGVYWLDDPDDPKIRTMPDNSIPYAFRIACDTLECIASDPDPANTVFAVNRGQTRGAVGNYTMLLFKGRSLTLKNLTLGNYCNVDLIYPRDPSLNRPRRCTPIVQAQLAICDGTDRVDARNCRFISRLNLCPAVGARRSFYDNCYFECTDDAMTGSAVYHNCRMTFYSSKPFYNTDRTGAVFLNCDIELRGSGTQYLTKVPGMVSMIDCRFTTPDGADREVRWTRDNSPSVSYYSNVTLNGRPLAIDADRPFMSVDLTGTHALDAYKVIHAGKPIYNTPNLLGGDDGWDPLGVLPDIKGLEIALDRKLIGLPVMMNFGTNRIVFTEKDESKPLSVTMLRWGKYPLTEDEITATGKDGIQFAFPTSVKLAHGDRFGHFTVSNANTLPSEMNGRIEAITAYGLRGIVETRCAPFLKEPPVYKSAPKLTVADGKITVDYALDVDIDRSHFEWYRCTTPELTDTIAIRHGNGRTFATYNLGAADIGSFIGVRIDARGHDTKAAAPVMLLTENKTVKRDVNRIARKIPMTYTTDFSDIPVRLQPLKAPDSWSFDSYKPSDTQQHAWEPNPQQCWYYGRGTDAATGIGLVQWTRGARAFYTPAVGQCRYMKANIELEPCKSAGQGFGSATGQYLDLYLKYDPATLSGYGLRIERTVDYDHAVAFTLMRFDNGKATPISAPQASTCYRTTCSVELSINQGLFTAKASTTAPIGDRVSGSDQLPSVDLVAEIDDSTDPATFGMQHTGSTGASATLIKNVSLAWE